MWTDILVQLQAEASPSRFLGFCCENMDESI